MVPLIVANVYIYNIYLFHNDIFPHFKLLLSNERLFVFVNFLNKRSKGLTMQIHFHSLLWSYLTKVPIFLAMTVNIYRHIVQLSDTSTRSKRAEYRCERSKVSKKKKNTERSQEHLELRELFEVKQSLLVRVS